MSADNWTLCPKCEVNRQKQIQRLERKIEEEYGKVSFEKHQEMIYKLKTTQTTPLDETLREDYSVGINEGFFDLTYSSHCSTCGFK
jgi:hypothetical protein